MLTREEIQILAEGLDALARTAKDVIMASIKLSAIRGKLEEMMRNIPQPEQPKNEKAEPAKKR